MLFKILFLGALSSLYKLSNQNSSNSNNLFSMYYNLEKVEIFKKNSLSITSSNHNFSNHNPSVVSFSKNNSNKLNFFNNSSYDSYFSDNFLNDNFSKNSSINNISLDESFINRSNENNFNLNRFNSSRSNINISNINISNVNNHPIAQKLKNSYNLTLVNSNLTPELDLKYSFMFIINFQVILFNVLIIAHVLKVKNFQKSNSAKYFVLSLAISDLIVGLIVMPFGIISLIVNTWIFGGLWCELWQIFDFFSCTASIFNLCTVSVDRYIAISKPLLYSSKMSSSRVYAIIIFVWFSAALVTFPPIIAERIGHVKVCQSPNCTNCDSLFDLYPVYVIFAFIASFFLPVLLVIITNYRTYLIVKQHMFSRNYNNCRINLYYSKKKKKTKKMKLFFNFFKDKLTKNKNFSNQNSTELNYLKKNSNENIKSVLNHDFSSTKTQNILPPSFVSNKLNFCKSNSLSLNNKTLKINKESLLKTSTSYLNEILEKNCFLSNKTVIGYEENFNNSSCQNTQCLSSSVKTICQSGTCCSKKNNNFIYKSCPIIKDIDDKNNMKTSLKNYSFSNSFETKFSSLNKVDNKLDSKFNSNCSKENKKICFDGQCNKNFLNKKNKQISKKLSRFQVEFLFLIEKNLCKEIKETIKDEFKKNDIKLFKNNLRCCGFCCTNCHKCEIILKRFFLDIFKSKRKKNFSKKLKKSLTSKRKRFVIDSCENILFQKHKNITSLKKKRSKKISFFKFINKRNPMFLNSLNKSQYNSRYLNYSKKENLLFNFFNQIHHSNLCCKPLISFCEKKKTLHHCVHFHLNVVYRKIIKKLKENKDKNKQKIKSINRYKNSLCDNELKKKSEKKSFEQLISPEPIKKDRSRSLTFIKNKSFTTNTKLNTIRREYKATKTLASITCVFIICWLPYYLSFVLQAVCSNCLFIQNFSSHLLWLGWCNSGLNPIIYMCLSKKIRYSLLNTLFCRI